jgi:hypothetical protein
MKRRSLKLLSSMTYNVYTPVETAMHLLKTNPLRFDTERELQMYLIRVLRSKGIAAKEEVPNGNVRADIVTPRAIIEVKRILDRESIYQALGQATVYQNNIGRKEIWIVGQSPHSTTEKQQAYRIACEAEKTPGVRVSFVDEDDFWLEETNRIFDSTPIRWLFLIMGTALIAWSLQRLQHCPALPTSRDPPALERSP